jgi:hypothetical protein
VIRTDLDLQKLHSEALRSAENLLHTKLFVDIGDDEIVEIKVEAFGPLTEDDTSDIKDDDSDDD